MSNPIAPGWSEVQPGVWRSEIGSHDRPTLTEAANAKPRRDRLAALPTANLPFRLDEIYLKKTRDYAVIQIPLQPGEKVYGLGLQMVGCNRRGGVFHLEVDHYASGHDRLHVPTPMYISSLGYAVLLNTSRPTNFYVGVGNQLADPKIPKFRDRNTDRKWDAQPDSGCVEASVQAPGLEAIVFTGPTAMDALRRYNLYCGGGAMPPLWALGFWHRTPSLATAQQVEDEVAEFARRGFPLDVVGLEPGWQSRSYPGSMEFDPGRFPDPAGFLRRMTGQGVHVNLWENPYVAPGTDLYNRLAARFGSHTVWLGAVPDVYDRKASEIVRKFHTEKHLSLGVSGYKIDEVDGFDNWLWPDHATFPSGPDGLQMRQIYGVLWQELIDRMFRQKGERTFGLVRGSNGAASRFNMAIYSDTYDAQQYLTALTNSPLAGTLWCAEIRSADTDQEWVRRMQMACLSPIAQLNAWDSGKKPWSYPAVEGPVREAMRLRESLAPYLYNTYAQYWRDGIPPIRPMCLVDGGLETDQYMLGDSLLVAPIRADQKSRTVRLPKGEWVDYQTGKPVGSGQITISPSLKDIPLFVRAGAAIPTHSTPDSGDQRASTSGAYVLRCYGPGPWKGEVYEDQGDGYGYEKGDFGIFDVHVSADGKQATATHREGLRMSSTRTFSVLIVNPGG
ncbi:MAG: ABC transporter substrate-binding protein [Armatimonadetes bacterium]|nr:ABC transporter substrate-binding protein [Armatimonadota bacterium]